MEQPTGQLSFPRPGKVLKRVLIVLFAIWLGFALMLNWGGLPLSGFERLTGSTAAIKNGELWRLVTAPLVHMPVRDISHILFTLLLLYFFGASLEEKWGGKRFLRFLVLTGTLAYSVQFLADLVLPVFISEKLIPASYFGGTPVVEACVIAWALSFKDRTVLLFFVLPVSAKVLIWLTVGFNILSVIAGIPSPSGQVALFAGMGFGWLLGGGTPSPLRKAYLKFKLGELERETQRERDAKRRRVKRSGLHVLPGGKGDRPPRDYLN